MPLLQQTILSAADWQPRAAAHRAKAEEWSLPFRQRAARRTMHPIYDFLFIYYRNTPGQLETWHPGIGTALEDAAHCETYQGKYYVHQDGLTRVDPTLLNEGARRRVGFALQLAKAIQNRPAQFGCYGMHEWAMVYRGDDDGEIRHGESLPLRVSQEAVNTFVESRPIACSHFDAFRFFTPSAQKFNKLQPGKDDRLDNEQCGCLHTNMDLYKWSAQCLPWVGSDLLWASFELAVKARELDMQASAYDCTSLGYDPIKVETPEGRTEYERRQRAITEAAQTIRTKLIQKLEQVLAAT